MMLLHNRRHSRKLFNIAKVVFLIMILASGYQLYSMAGNSLIGLQNAFDAQPVMPAMFDDRHRRREDGTRAKELRNSQRILCWVMTTPENLETKAKHVKATWGRRCTVLLFISSKADDAFPAIGVDALEGRDHLTAKTMQAFQYIYDHYYDAADWFMKTDDDTFVILENLHYLLADYNNTEPLYFGHRFRELVDQGYASGGAGYVISKEALKRFGTRSDGLCATDGGAEDVDFGKCMANLGVQLGNTTDALGRSRFHCFDLDLHLFGDYPDWYYQYDANGGKMGADSISDYAISFHYVTPKMMYHLEYYTYHLKPYRVTQEDLI